MDGRQVKEPSHNTVKTDTATAVGRNTSAAEHIDVLLDALAVGVDALLAQASLKHGGDVDTLASRQNFLR